MQVKTNDVTPNHELIKFCYSNTTEHLSMIGLNELKVPHNLLQLGVGIKSLQRKSWSADQVWEEAVSLYISIKTMGHSVTVVMTVCGITLSFKGNRYLLQ